MRSTVQFLIVLCFLSLHVGGLQAQQAAGGSSMPVQRNTGNPAADEAAYIAAKKQWIKEHPEAAGPPPSGGSLVGKPADGGPGPISEKLMPSPPPPRHSLVDDAVTVNTADPAFFKLASIKAVNLNNRVSAEHFAHYEEQAANEFAKNNLVVDWEKKLLYTLPRNSSKPSTIHEINVAGGTLELMNCVDCTSPKFSIAEQTATKLVVLIVGVDGAESLYQVEFTK